MAILKTDNLRKFFGGVKAVDGVTIAVNPREIRAIIGPNGAGKSTFLNLISGRYPPSGGKIWLREKEITGLSPHKISRLGIIKSFQTTNIFEGLTVYENIQVAVISFEKKGMIFFKSARSFETIHSRILRLLEIIGLKEKASWPCTSLSHGEQRHLEIALALAGRPHVLLLDEPTAGMTPYESGMTMDLIKRLSKEQGVTIVFAEHDMNVVFGISDKITVMNQGKIIVEGSPAEIRANELVKKVYLGHAYEDS